MNTSQESRSHQRLAENERLEESRTRDKHWKRWGPYVSERAWGTVREDYSSYGTAWEDFPHDQARSRAYRWNEDGLAGICDRHQNLCFALALWNRNDPILKERLFGLTGNEGNHAEDVKEYYFYLDNTPTHSYMKFLYKYPQGAYPYSELLNENRRRGREQSEYELLDTGIFDEDRYFDVIVEYAKADIEDILIRITVCNRGPSSAELDLLPTRWFRNTWSWGGDVRRPTLFEGASSLYGPSLEVVSEEIGRYWLHCKGDPELLFTDNDTNTERLFGLQNQGFVKDGINDFIVNGEKHRVNPERNGTKVSAHYHLELPPGGSSTVELRLTNKSSMSPAFGRSFEDIFNLRIAEADEFYRSIIPSTLTIDANNVMRQALSGLLWSKQFYHYVVRDWLQGDEKQPRPPDSRLNGRNSDWTHLYNADVLSMPDKWEYPWFAAWDLSFHCVALSLVDSDFAKDQLLLMLREWYMHPNGQLPAYEWAFGDVSPPVHAWAAWRVYKIEKRRKGPGDIAFLEAVFHKLLLNFTWWVNRKDAAGMNVFEGGFLGLDNIGVFDRSAPLPTGGYIEQSDGTSWMAMYTLNLLTIANELAEHNPVYENVASKFWEHFLHIAHAMNHNGRLGNGLWDCEDDFFYDVLHTPDDQRTSMKVRSMVGLVPLFAVETLEPEDLERMPGFSRRMKWFVENRPDLTNEVACIVTPGQQERRLLALVGEEKLRMILRVMLDEREFLSPYGIRALSMAHGDHPFVLEVEGTEYRVAYEPAESTTGTFGGNSNWRGPIWFPMNYLIIESLQKFHHYYGDAFRVECPTGSGCHMTLSEVAADLSRRLSGIFLNDNKGSRPVYSRVERFRSDPHWKDLVLFYEYFHGEDGSGMGASHQTGWTALVAKLLQQSGTAEDSETNDKPSEEAQRRQTPG
jgi:hypothetical protein